MKRAFTLIELLVVIAIIAILAAILFPVFAQAKVAAKKTSALSNQKQISLGIMQYMIDYDDLYPRNDDCYAGSSMNPAITLPFPAGGVGAGCTAAPFVYRKNHFAWQWWIMPYVKNVDIFKHPARAINNTSNSSCPNGQWADCGQITASFALNTALTGALNTYPTPASSRAYRNSFRGGNQSGIPNVSAAMILMETGNPTSALVPHGILSGDFGLQSVTVYPGVPREIFNRAYFTQANCTTISVVQVDPRRTLGEGIAVGFADGSAKHMSVKAIAAKTPTIAEYSPGIATGGTNCDMAGSTQTLGATVNINIDYPFWALGN